jgi:putative transposase
MGAVPRVLRTTLPDGYFHVASRGVNGCAIFRDDDDRRSFLANIQTCAERYRWTLHALCLMTTHYHLVLHSTQPELSRGLQRVQGRYAQAFNERHGRFGHLFADRFAARAIEDERYLYAACSYVVENPVRAGLCDSIDDWPWSHSRHHPRAAATPRRPTDRAQGPALRATYQPISIS